MQQAHSFKKKQTHGEVSAGIPQPAMKCLKNWKHHLLVVEDELNYESMVGSHRYICTQLAREFAALLFLSHDEFFKVLHMQEDLTVTDDEEQQSKGENGSVFRLRACLESCLQVFSRSSYLIFTDEKSQIGSSALSTTTNSDSTKQYGQAAKGKPNEKESYWQKLKEIVLMVFKRISCASTSGEKIILINGWYLDTCKLLDICLIYGTKYKTDVIEIVRNLFSKGPEQDDFNKDFKQVLDLAYQKLKELCEEFQGFPEIDFVKLKQDSRQYSNYHNAESTLTKSITRLFFSTYDILKNLQAILEYFPSRCKVQLLGNPLILKRFIMIYNKIRYYDENHWRFGSREGYFRPLINETITRLVAFVESSMIKTAMLIRQLPSKSHFKEEVKKSFLNFWYFTYVTPAVSYEYKDVEERLKQALEHGSQLGNLVLSNKPNELFSNAILSCFNKNNKSFQSMKPAAMMSKKIHAFNNRIKVFEKVESWRLPSYTQFLRANYISKPKKDVVKVKQPQFSNEVSSKQYEDQPFFADQQQQLYTEYHQNDQSGFLSLIQDEKQSALSKSKQLTQQTSEYFEEVSCSSIEANSEHMISQAFTDSKAYESDSIESSIVV